MYTISENALTIINENPVVKGRVASGLMERLRVNAPSTIYAWLRYKSIMLTTADAVEVISEHTGLTAGDVIRLATDEELAALPHHRKPAKA